MPRRGIGAEGQARIPGRTRTTIMKTIRYDVDASGIATVTFDAPDAAVNTMTQEWQRDLAEVAAQLVGDKGRLKGVLLVSAKSTFFAGAALKHVLTLTAA